MNYEAARIRQPGDALSPAFIRRCREKRGMSYEQVRRSMGLKSRSTPLQWENGTVVCSGPVAELFLIRVAGENDPFFFDDLLTKADELWGGAPPPLTAHRTFGWRLSSEAQIDFGAAWGSPGSLLLETGHGEWPPQRGLGQAAVWGPSGVEIAFPLPDDPGKQVVWCMQPDLAFVFRRLGFEDSPDVMRWRGEGAEKLGWFGRRETLHLALATCCFFQRVARTCIEDHDATVEIFGELRGTKGRIFWEPPAPQGGLHPKNDLGQSSRPYEQDIVECRISKTVKEVCEEPHEAAIEIVAKLGGGSNPALAKPQALREYLQTQKDEADKWFKGLVH